MAEEQHPLQYGFAPEAFDWTRLPDIDTDFLPPGHVEAFIQALAMPDQPSQSSSDDATRRSSLHGTPSSPHRPGITRRNSGSASAGEGSRRSLPSGGLQDEGQDPRVVAAHAAAASAQIATPPQRQQEQAQRHQQQQQQRASFYGTNRSNSSLFISAQNDWAPVYEEIQPSSALDDSSATRDSDHDNKRRYRLFRRRRYSQSSNTEHGSSDGVRENKDRRRRGNKPRLQALVGTRSKDETREGYLYGLVKWPLLAIVGIIVTLWAIAYLAIRFYISMYEQGVAWRGRRKQLRRTMRETNCYSDWVVAARRLDDFLGNTRWKEEDEFAYYVSGTVKRVRESMRKCRMKAEEAEKALGKSSSIVEGGIEGDAGVGRSSLNAKEAKNQLKSSGRKAVEDLRALIGACVKTDFVGIENPRLYSQTYYGTKNLAQNFVDEAEASLRFLLTTRQLPRKEKRILFKSIHSNYGRTALCLSGGATFAYYHFGVVKAFLDAGLLPDIITGTSGGALVAALVATRTNDELKELLVPALARRLTACEEPYTVRFWRWWRTGAYFDSVHWARKCAWFCRGSMTFREAYERTGRILNVSCVPADPHSPTILCNYRTSPDCVIWSAVIASAAVPGILNPVVLMMKTRDTGALLPYSFGHKWKDGSLRTDIPIRALNLHFNVNFTVVSQVNPHVSLFFFSSRGSAGQPVTHRKGRGWRGGYLGSAVEQYVKLELVKWLQFLRQLELLPRPLGQDWSQLWLQRFGGTVTIWPEAELPGDLCRILSDPGDARLARMLHEGQQSAFPKLKFVANRLGIERLIERGRRENRVSMMRETDTDENGIDGLESAISMSEEDDEEERGGRGAAGPVIDGAEDAGETIGTEYS